MYYKIFMKFSYESCYKGTNFEIFYNIEDAMKRKRMAEENWNREVGFENSPSFIIIEIDDYLEEI